MKTWTAPLLTFVIASCLPACIVVNENHCGLNDGVCSAGLMCSKCQVENNGCAPAESISLQCQLGSTGTASEGASSTMNNTSQPMTDTTNPTEPDTGQNLSTSGDLTTDPVTTTDPLTTDPVTTTDVSTSTTGGSTTDVSTTGTTDASTTDNTTGPAEPQFIITYTGPAKTKFGLNANGLTVTKAELTGADEMHHLTSLTVFARKGGCGTPEGQSDTSIVAVELFYTDPDGGIISMPKQALVNGQTTFALDAYLFDPNASMPLSVRADSNALGVSTCVGFVPVPGVLETVGTPPTHTFG